MDKSLTVGPEPTQYSIRYSTGNAVRLLFASSLLGVCGIFLAIRGQPQGWFGVVILIAGVTLSFRQLSDKSPKLTITEYGINDLRTKYGLIRWEEISSASLSHHRHTTFLYLQLRNVAQLGFDMLPINLGDLDISPDDALAAVESYLRFKTHRR